jgi:hypothetical protein
MSTQVFDNVRVNDVFYSTIAQARDATGVTVQDANGTTLLQVSTGTVLLFGDQRQENNGIQKQVYLNQCTVGSSAGNYTVPVLNITLPSGAYSGFKVFVTITNTAGSLVKFDEYIGNATWTAAGGVANVWQLASTPASCIAASVACIADATSASIGAASVSGGSATYTLSLAMTVSGSSPGSVTANVYCEHYGSKLATLSGPL